MALHYIFGDSGAGKSRFLCETILKLAKKNPKERFFVLVPEQFTLQTQKDFVTLQPDTPGIMNIDVLSFLRLAYRIFEQTGDNDRIVLEDTGKSMIVKKVAIQCAEKLEIFGRNVQKAGFISEIKSVISEFYQYGIGEEELNRMRDAAGVKPALSKKLNDLSLLYQGFQDFLADRYITAEGVLDLLRDRIPGSELLAGSTICFDGYTGFTPSQYKLIEQLLRCCKECYVTVTIPPSLVYHKLKEHELFYLSSKTVQWIDTIAAKSGQEIEKPVVLLGIGRYNAAPSLAFLAAHLFRPNISIYHKKQQDIHIFTHKNIQEEISWTVTKIYQLIKQGYRYRDIAVITADLDSYADGFTMELARAKLPGFIDRKKKLMDNPVVEFVNAAMEIALQDFSYDSVFHYMKSPLSGFTKEECDMAENYILALGIRRYSGYTKEWTRKPRTKYTCPIEDLNEVRKKLVEKLSEFYCVMRGTSTTTEKLTALYWLLAAHGAEKYLEEQAEAFMQTEPLRAGEYQQLWRILLEIFDRMAGLLGEEKLALKEFRELLQTGFQEAKVGLVPPGIDQVVVGDMERTRLSDVRVLFFVGMNEGVVPKPVSGGGVLSEQDRDLFAVEGIELAPNRRQSTFLSEYYLYLSLTKPSDKLFLSYRRMDVSGKSMRPSYLLGKVMKLFDGLHPVEIPEEDMGRCLNTDSGLSWFLQGIQQYLDNPENAPAYFTELYRAYFHGELPMPLNKEAITAAAFYKKPEKPLSSQEARKLYGDQLSGSVTRLEQYAACAFSHFLSYGLELEERAQYEVRMPDIGMIYHEALQRFSASMKEENYRWHDVPKPEMERLLKEAVQEAVNNYGNGIFSSTSRNAWLLVRIERMLKRTVVTVQSQIRSGDFEPELFEYGFIHADRYLSLKGRIDRIDKCEDDQGTYLRVVDYKSGITQFSLEKLYYGLQVQLAVYMDAALTWAREHGIENAKPAGMLYYRIDDPVVNKGKDVEKELKKKLAMKGLVNSETDSLVHQDRAFYDSSGGLAAGVVSDVIPAATLKGGQLSGRSMAADASCFEDAMDCVKEGLYRSAEKIMQGDVDPAPYRKGAEDACTWCSFHDACGFDRKIEGYRYRTLEKIDSEELWDKIRERGAKDEQGGDQKSETRKGTSENGELENREKAAESE